MEFSPDHAWVQMEDGKWKVVSIENIEAYPEAYPGIRRVEVRGYRNAKDPAELLYNHPQISLSSGVPHGPPTPQEEAFATFIKGVFVASGMAAVAGGFLLYGGRKRAGILLLGASVILAMAGILLVRFDAALAEAPLWQWILAAAIIALLLGTGLGEAWGEKVKEKFSRDRKESSSDNAKETASKDSSSIESDSPVNPRD